MTRLLDRQLSHRLPQFLPGGRQFLFYTEGGIHLGSLDSGDVKRLIPADTAGMYVPDGWLLWVRDGTLVAQRLDLKRWELTGDLVTVADPVGSNGRLGAFSVSAAGLVAYRAGGATRRQLIWFDRAGKPLDTLGAADEVGHAFPDISPNGRRVAAQRNIQGNTDIWLLDGARTSRFTFDPGADTYPVWSPDASRIVFRSTRNREENIYIKPSNGVGIEERLLESSLGWDGITIHDWSPDGGSSCITSVIHSNESGRYEIYVRPFAGAAAADSAVSRAGGQWQVSTAGGVVARWRADGKELYYIAPDGRLMAAPITVIGNTLEAGTPEALFQTRIVGGGTEPTIVGRQYDVSSDGRFLINTLLEDVAAPITLLQNWKPPAQ